MKHMFESKKEIQGSETHVDYITVVSENNPLEVT